MSNIWEDFYVCSFTPTSKGLYYTEAEKDGNNMHIFLTKS